MRRRPGDHALRAHRAGAAPAAAARAVVAVSDRAVNERRAGRDDPTWIGTIRGGYGDPVKSLNADAPAERATGREVWRDRQRACNVYGSLLSLSTGVPASTEDLRRVALRTMGEAVDALLDKPGFRAAARRG